MNTHQNIMQIRFMIIFFVFKHSRSRLIRSPRIFIHMERVQRAHFRHISKLFLLLFHHSFLARCWRCRKDFFNYEELEKCVGWLYNYKVSRCPIVKELIFFQLLPLTIDGNLQTELNLINISLSPEKKNYAART